mgnify:CR=1 FL=1
MIAIRDARSIATTRKAPLVRIHQEDACQFLDRYPADKYRLTLRADNARLRAQVASDDAIRDLLRTIEALEVEKKRLTDAPLVIGIVSFTKPHPKVPAFEQELVEGMNTSLGRIKAAAEGA